MKKTNYIKGILLQLTFVATVFLIVSCGNNEQSNDAGDLAQEQNEAKFDNDKQKSDAQFLVNASENNLKQIQLGNLAQQKGNAGHVKEFGKMVKEAHTKSQRDLTVLAKRKMINIPTSQNNRTHDAYKELNEESGNDFDEAFTNMMVSGHKDAISDFEKASTDSHDRDIKKWATTELRGLRNHLDHAMDCQKKLASMYFEKNK